MVEQAAQFVPAFVLTFFRLAAMMLAAPLFGSVQIPKRVKVLLALVLAFSETSASGRIVALPAEAWQLAVGIGGEILFGLAMGTAVGLVFVAVHWAGEIIGQQMGLGLGQLLDPQYGGQTTIVGDLYFLLTLVVFLLVRGHHALLKAVHASFSSLPLLSAGINADVVALMLGLLTAATTLALQLAAPMLVTMLVVELVMGFIGKSVRHFNVMSAALTLRSAVGLVVLAVGVALTSDVMREALVDAIQRVGRAWSGG